MTYTHQAGTFRIANDNSPTGQKIKWTKTRLPKAAEWFFIIFSGVTSLIVFLGASSSFSYDYIHYIRYFKELQNLSLQDLLASVWGLLPYPYIFVPPSGFFEFGFGFTSWILMLVFRDSSITYAVIGALSIATRTWALRSIGVNWLWVLVLNIYAVTLFEANAIRLGCAFTLILLGLRLILLQKRTVATPLFFFAAVLFHLQTLLFVIFFSLVFYGYRIFIRSRWRLAVSLLVIISIIFFGLRLLNDLSISKLADYAQKNSAATGFTSISVLGFLMMATTIGSFFMANKQRYYALTMDLSSRLWLATIFAAVPALLLLFLATSTGALGDRLWQLSFAMVSSLIFANGSREKYRLWAGILLIILMGVSIVNVIYRYPLSNFFYPIVPYININADFFSSLIVDYVHLINNG